MLSRAARPALRAGASVSRSVTPTSVATYATLREIEGRLKSIRNIEKITKTMKIVASTKLTRAQRAMFDSRTYGETSNGVFEAAETKVGGTAEAAEAGAAAPAPKKKLLVVCSSDKGLCGGIHSGLSRTVRRLFAEKALAGAAPQTSYDLVLLGEKSKAQLQRTNSKDIVLTFAGVGRAIPTFAEAQAIADQIVQLPGEYESIEILYNKFLNAQSFEPAIIPAYSEEDIAASPNLSSFEVEESTLPNLREYALANSLFWALAEGHACEQSARRNAMDNASKNAGEMINRYQILFNRTRQAVITGELVEIITGATASEDM